MVLSVTTEDVETAYGVISPHIRRTPILRIEPQDAGLAVGLPPVALKLEFLQHTGSFKARGALVNVMTRDVPAAGIAAASGGNHGAAVAWAARQKGVHATIFVPSIAPPAKIARIKEYGAEVHVGGEHFSEALAACRAHMAESGAMGIHAFDQAETLAGQGTVALEFVADADVDTILVAVGGGGLIGGMAAWAAGRCRIISVEPENAASMHAAFAAGAPIEVPVSGLAADSLGAPQVGALPFAVAQDFVAATLTVPDSAIDAAMRHLWARCRIVAEPGGATALAPLLCGAYRPAKGERIGVLLCGADTGVVKFDS